MTRIERAISLCTRRDYAQLGPFTVAIVRSTSIQNGDVVVDVFKTAGGTYGFILYTRRITNDPRCDGCYTHRWHAIMPSPSSETYANAMEADFAAMRCVVETGVCGHDDTDH